MAGSARRIFLLTILLAASSVAGRGAHADAQSGRLAPWRVERDVLRFKTVASDNVMEVLAIRPGMSILDIGAGTGQFAYEFAGRLSGTGTVYATDANDACVEHIRNEADRRGLRNLHAVLVKKEGVDAFYGRRKYDLITVFHLSSMTYENQVGYFRELRDSLAEGGRLVLILYKTPAPFSPGDFTGDFRELAKALSLEPADSPFSRRLRESTRSLIRDNSPGRPPAEVAAAVVEDLNAMMSDARFYLEFLDGSVLREGVDLLPDERAYVGWQTAPLKGTRGHDRGIRTAVAAGTDNRAKRDEAVINKLLITQRFRRFLRAEGLFVSGFTPAIRAAFEKAGYRLVREYPDVIPFEDLIVFSAR